MKIEELLQEYHFSEKQIKLLLSRAIEIDVKRQEVVYDFKTPLESFYFVEKGGFVLKYWDENSQKEITVNFFLDSFTPFMGDINSYFKGVNTASKILAIKNSKIFAFHKSDIEFFSETMDVFRIFFTNRIVEALVVEHNFRINLITKTKQNFYSYLLNDYPEIIRDVPSKYIAEFMGISPEWLSKIRQKSSNS